MTLGGRRERGRACETEVRLDFRRDAGERGGLGETESGGEPGGEKKRSVEWVLSSERSVGSGDGTGGRARGAGPSEYSTVLSFCKS